MTIKLITITAAVFALMVNGAFAQQSDKTTSDVAATASKAKKGYIHKPDSTMYHPGNGVSKTMKGSAPAKARKGYIHKPDSTMYHPQKEKK